MQKYKLDLDLPMFITVPLGYYVGWMEWLAWVNVVAYTVLMMFVFIFLTVLQKRWVDELRAHDIVPTVSWNPLKSGNIKVILVCGVLFWFEWTAFASIIACALIAFKLLVSDTAREVEKG